MPFARARRWAWLALPFALGACAAMSPSIARQYQDLLRSEEAAHPAPAERVFNEADLKALPEPVQRYARLSGAVGRPVPWAMRVEFDALMRRKPGDGGMKASSVQLNYFDPPSRSFHMRARMFGLPVGVLHHYGQAEASMQVRVAGLFNAVDIRSRELFQAECVTVLNDLCIMAPGRLTDPRLAWKALDNERAEVAFTNQGLTVKAVLHVNAAGELVDFVSEDRLALQPDGTLKRFRFNTPLHGYRDYDGLRLAGEGEAVYAYPEGPFTYGEFKLKSVRYNAAALAAGG